MRLKNLLITCVLADILVLGFTAPLDKAQVEKGKELFARRCSGCHAADTNKEGPRLRGVYGRKAGGVAEFPYSDSLKALKVQWGDASLDRWLSDPDAMAPENDMAFRMSSAEERRVIIVYLKSLQ